ncbi:ATP-binding cassette domain-containing protein [Sulfobacillus thermosulfidooxidans]|uniref:ATP-binding cassette domain-containing protein n=1 Tax=Sulfobacillus thermosulfidooxidans TaxID=28034 RepID=UPI00096BAC4B|nr:ABC transporter ATP-binding protein [Sulfobacillus thermosulfidooxidans]OLZ12177.1 hypothetical protein BFX05_00215 [Sulfobacillus thermosulfidooxidans]OLZ13043.1 hypothetical protein BFX06_10840 [Sulfobacillus thermosulfidooxidans]OLZ21423.1 hypothetical protein BFX07_11265 [Sulfobacillus thermosulfidooxidans]
MLSWSAVTMGFDREHPIFTQLNLTIYPSMSVIGPSGSGKSTLLSSLLGYVSLFEGEILIDGVPADRNVVGQLISYMPQENILPGDLTLREYLSELAELDGQKSIQVKETVYEMASLVHLESVLDRRLGHMSGGMKRRALLAAVLLYPAPWVIIDEPTSGLDPEEQLTVLGLLAELSQKRHVVIATSRLEEVAALQGDMVLVLPQGQVEIMSRERLQAMARGHVFVLPDHEVDLGRTRLWQPMPDGQVKIFSDKPLPHAVSTEPTLEDGYYWYLSQRELMVS